MRNLYVVLALFAVTIMLSGCCQDGKREADGPVIIASRMHVKSGCIGEFKKIAAPLIEATRQEEGCLQYDLYQDSSDSTVFFFYEVYADRTAQELHSASEYLARFKSERQQLVCGPSDVTVYDAEVRKPGK